MKIFCEEDTIVAVSTAPGEGAIGILRLSGSSSFEILSNIYRPLSRKNKRNMEALKSHKLQLGHLIIGGNNIDRVLACIMRAPRTYTGEDMVEIHCHGGPAILRAALEEAVKNGARCAEPGEFTKRAFLHGRIDLAQAESVAEIIKSKCIAGAKMSLKHLEGEFSNKLEKILCKARDLHAEIEVALDFPEEEVPPLKNKDIVKRGQEILKGLHSIITQSIDTRWVTE
ncbi:MAG: hypothetical protein P9M03_12230, partial [Candidatus Theseobacter exili]|nr:hypothetical protein [Candidatus Theseobacter exili]